jgi:hypothetical protein
MLSLTKAQVFAMIGSDEASECRSVLIKDKAVRFSGLLKVNRELTYNPLIRYVIEALGPGRQSLVRIVDRLGNGDSVAKAVVQQTLYALVNAEYINFIQEGNQSVVEVRNVKMRELLSDSCVDGERRPLTAHVSLRKENWSEEPHFCDDKSRLNRAIEFPADGIKPSSASNRSIIERLVLERPPNRRLYNLGSGVREQRNEVLEKAGLLNMKLKVVGLDVEKAAFVNEFWVSQCLVFRGIPGTCGYIVKPLKSWRRNPFSTALQQMVETNRTFRNLLIERSDEVKII